MYVCMHIKPLALCGVLFLKSLHLNELRKYVLMFFSIPKILQIDLEQMLLWIKSCKFPAEKMYQIIFCLQALFPNTLKEHEKKKKKKKRNPFPSGDANSIEPKCQIQLKLKCFSYNIFKTMQNIIWGKRQVSQMEVLCY